MLKMWKQTMVVAGAVVFSVAGTSFAQVRIQGAGATFPAPLYKQWVDAYHKAHPEVTPDYQAVGSGAGIKAITDRTVILGASDAPMSKAQLDAAPAPLLHLPTVAGPEVMTYNLDGVNKLTLNGDVIADIYLKSITKWNDPKIAALNAGVALPDAPIVVVHRSDGSGTSFIFTDYLSKVSKKWADDVGTGTTVDWPVGLGGKGNDGVAAAVQNTKGGIGYVELAYAKDKKLPTADLMNKSGHVVPPSIDAINAAAASAVANWPGDMKVSITNSDVAEAYPICGFTYLLVYDDLSYIKDKAQATELLNFIKWCETDGQDMAKDLGYAKLPKDVQDKVIAKLKTIKFDGEALLK